MSTTEQSTKTLLADFRPFRAWRYNPAKVKIQDVIAPPYDVISPDEQKRLYERSQLNCIRLILNQIESTDTEQNSRYTRARDHFADWQKQGILIQEEKPCFYYYQQTFKHPVDGSQQTRIALLGKIKLVPFEEQIVIPHEKTLAKARADRKLLLEATHTNFSPIFGLYEHDHGQMEAIDEKILSRRPMYQAVDDQGVRHVLCAIDDEKIQKAIQESIRSQRIYIADGHHRYTVSLHHAQAQRKELNIVDGIEIDSDFTLMALVHFFDPGLVILPTHRMIQSFEGYETEKMAELLKKHFDLKPMPVRKILEELQKKHDALTFGVYFESQESYLLTLKDRTTSKALMPEGHAETWYDLDVAAVSHLILGHLWKLPESEWEAKIRYTHSDQEALSAVLEGNAVASFLLKAPQVELLRDMGNARELMPQKSTYFYPKLISGYVFNQHERVQKS